MFKHEKTVGNYLISTKNLGKEHKKFVRKLF